MNDAHARRIEALELWQGPIAIEPLAGGITNDNYRVADAAGSYVARLCIERPHLGIDRHNEVVCHRAAHACGVAPEVVFYECGVLVSRWVEGRTLAPADVRDPAVIPRVAAALHTLHGGWDELAGEILYFSPFQAIRTYARTASARQARLPDDLDELVRHANRLSREVPPFVPALCHNDLLASNLIAEGDRVRLVDWEYAGMGHPFFDLAGVSANCGFDDECDRVLLAAYRGEAVAHDLRLLRLFKTASYLRDSLWGMIQTVASDLDFDYQKYADDNLAMYRAARSRLDSGPG